MPEWVCPRCTEPRTGRFCEVDGYDSELRPEWEPPDSVESAARPESWLLVVTADRKYHEFVQHTGNAAAAAMVFPKFCPERRFRLRGGQLLIGRHSVSRGIAPDIDLTGPPEDLAIGRAHAVLEAGPDGSWTLVDLASTNGTFLNYGTNPVDPNVPVPVGDGDRIHVGGWTTLTLHANA